MSSELYIGLISGTSMDAVDGVLVTLEGDKPRFLVHHALVLPHQLKTDLLDLCKGTASLSALGKTDLAVARLFARCVHELLDKSGHSPAQIQAIGSHGQTIWHEPPQASGQHGFTIQLGDPNTLAELTGITTVADFRRRDMAAGGQGAPIVPALHQALFQHKKSDRIVLNLGGIANITYLPASTGKPLGLDTGPANVLMDGWIARHMQQAFDREGTWAAIGKPNADLLRVLLDEAYFQRAAPKSTGRELFNLQWLDTKLQQYGHTLAPADIQATLLMLTVESICLEITKLVDTGEVLVCGGGVNNLAMMNALRKRLPACSISSTSTHGLDAVCVEAVAFAWFASKALKREPIDFSPFTGATGPVIAGGVYFARQENPNSDRE